MLQLMRTLYFGVNKLTIVAQGENLHEANMNLQKVSLPSVKQCGLCGGEVLFLSSYETKEGHKYTKLVCASCKGSVTCGRPKKDQNTFYFRKTEDGKLDWQAYDKSGKHDDDAAL